MTAEWVQDIVHDTWAVRALFRAQPVPFTQWGSREISTKNSVEMSVDSRLMDWRGTTRAEDARGTPTQCHVSPIMLVDEDQSIVLVPAIHRLEPRNQTDPSTKPTAWLSDQRGFLAFPFLKQPLPSEEGTSSKVVINST